MKKFGWIIGSCLLLVGCTASQEISISNITSEVVFAEDQVTVFDEESIDNSSKDVAQYYVHNEKVWEQVAEIVKLLNKNAPNTYYDSNPSGYSLGIEWETIENLGVPLSESVYGEELEKVYPGIVDFIKGVEAETSDKVPQSMISNGALIKMIPMHLYDINTGTTRNQSYLQIYNDGVILQNAYFKQLAKATPQDQFIASEPYLSGVNQMLRMHTPAFENRSYMGQYESGDYVRPELAYETNALGYQLYVRDNHLQKIRLVGKRLPHEKIDETLFEPLLTWCQEEFGMDEDQLQIIRGHIPEIAQGQKQSLEENLGEYHYTYEIYDKGRLYGSEEGRQKEQLFELVIEKK